MALIVGVCNIKKIRRVLGSSVSLEQSLLNFVAVLFVKTSIWQLDATGR